MQSAQCRKSKKAFRAAIFPLTVPGAWRRGLVRFPGQDQLFGDRLAGFHAPGKSADLPAVFFHRGWPALPGLQVPPEADEVVGLDGWHTDSPFSFVMG